MSVYWFMFGTRVYIYTDSPGLTMVQLKWFNLPPFNFTMVQIHRHSVKFVNLIWNLDFFPGLKMILYDVFIVLDGFAQL